MIKFFNKIRRGSLEESNFSKYLLYAIGEILLVMIGILLALEVSNWNDERKEREIKKSMLAGVLRGLVKDSSDIAFNIRVHSQSLNSQKIVIGWIEGNSPFPDSLKRHISLCFRFTQFVSQDGPYEILKTTGLRLITNDTLQEEISSLYDVDYDLQDEHEKYYTSLIMKSMQDINQDFFDVSNPVVYGAPNYEGAMTPLSPEQLRTDNRFNYHLKTSMYENKMFIFYVMDLVRKRINRVKKMIRKELEKE